MITRNGETPRVGEQKKAVHTCDSEGVKGENGASKTQGELKLQQQGQFGMCCGWNNVTARYVMGAGSADKTLTLHSLALWDPAHVSHCLNPNRATGKRAYKMQSTEVRLLEHRAGHRGWIMNLGGQVGRGTKITSTGLCVYNTLAESIRALFTSFSDPWLNNWINFWTLVSFHLCSTWTWLFSAIQRINCSTIIQIQDNALTGRAAVTWVKSDPILDIFQK